MANEAKAAPKKAAKKAATRRGSFGIKVFFGTA